MVELDQLVKIASVEESLLLTEQLLVADFPLVLLMLLSSALPVVILELSIPILFLALTSVVMPSLVCLLLSDPLVAAEVIATAVEVDLYFLPILEVVFLLAL